MYLAWSVFFPFLLDIVFWILMQGHWSIFQGSYSCTIWPCTQGSLSKGPSDWRWPHHFCNHLSVKRLQRSTLGCQIEMMGELLAVSNMVKLVEKPTYQLIMSPPLVVEGQYFGVLFYWNSRRYYMHRKYNSDNRSDPVITYEINPW